MTGLTLYAHPFSSFCGKVLIALYENATPFTYLMLDNGDASNRLRELWPIVRFPLLTDGDRTIPETTIIIEYLQQHYPGRTRFIPDDPELALEVRFMDRFFDTYVMERMQKIVFDVIRDEKDRDPYGVKQAREMLDKAYGWLDGRLEGRRWAAGEAFSMADCAAAPSLFFADWVHPIPAQLSVLKDYRRRVLAHPAVSRVVDEARPYRHLFPPGAPDRD